MTYNQFSRYTKEQLRVMWAKIFNFKDPTQGTVSAPVVRGCCHVETEGVRKADPKMGDHGCLGG